jgi:SnoaL-like domain
MIEPAHVQDLIGKWWFAYDQANFEQMSGLLTADMRFVCRTDTGQTEWEEFVRADVSGRETVMAWQTTHRMGSPSPLRHNSSNIHLTRQDDDEADFASYILATHNVGGFPSPLPSGVVTGTVRSEGGALRISQLTVVLDTQDSVALSERTDAAQA